MEWPGWTPNGALLREFQSFFLDGEDGRSSVGLRQNVGNVLKRTFCPLRNKSSANSSLNHRAQQPPPALTLAFPPSQRQSASADEVEVADSPRRPFITGSPTASLLSPAHNKYALRRRRPRRAAFFPRGTLGGLHRNHVGRLQLAATRSAATHHQRRVQAGRLQACVDRPLLCPPAHRVHPALHHGRDQPRRGGKGQALRPARNLPE